MKNNIKSCIAIAATLSSLLCFSTVTQADIISDTDDVIGRTWVTATSPLVGYGPDYGYGYRNGYGYRTVDYRPDYSYGYRTTYVSQPGYLTTCDRGCVKARHTHLVRDANGHWTKKTYRACDMRNWY